MRRIDIPDLRAMERARGALQVARDAAQTASVYCQGQSHFTALSRAEVNEAYERLAEAEARIGEEIALYLYPGLHAIDGGGGEAA